METKTEQKTGTLSTLGKAAIECFSLTELELSVFCGLKGIESKESFLKRLQKTEAQLSEKEKKELEKKWSPSDLLQIFLDCKIAGVNPASRDVHIMKYGEKPTLVIGYQNAIKKANSDPNYDGMKSGVITINDKGEINRRQGAWTLPNEELIAGWAEVYRKDRTHPEVAEVAFSEHRMNNAKKVWDEASRTYSGEIQNEMWKTRPAQQIVKVAVSQATNRAFSYLFGNATIGDVEEIQQAEFTEIKETEVFKQISAPTTTDNNRQQPTEDDELEKKLENAAKGITNNPFK